MEMSQLKWVKSAKLHDSMGPVCENIGLSVCDKVRVNPNCPATETIAEYRELLEITGYFRSL